MKKCLFAYNPQSGKGKIVKREKYIVDSLSQKYEVTVLRSEYIGHIGEYISMHGEEFDTIVVAGGDGTLNETINSVIRLNKTIQIGYIPCGTVNDVAHSLGIPRNVKKALKVILDGKIFLHDVFKCNDRYGIYVCCSGIFTEASYATSQSSKRKVGKIAYGLHGIKKIFSTNSLEVNLSFNNGEICEKCCLMLIINSKNVAGFKINKHAILNDGKVDVVLVKAKKNRVRLCEILRVAKLFLFGIPKKSSKNIEVLHLDSLKIETTPTTAINIDGESLEKGSFELTVYKQKVAIFVPRNR